MASLRFSGVLDRRAAIALTPHLLDLASHGDELALDLSAVSMIDAAGLQMLLAVRREAVRARTRLALHNPSPAVSDALGRHHLPGVLGCYVRR